MLSVLKNYILRPVADISNNLGGLFEGEGSDDHLGRSFLIYWKEGSTRFHEKEVIAKVCATFTKICEVCLACGLRLMFSIRRMYGLHKRV